MSAYSKPGTLPRPGPLGRATRFVLGVAVLYFFVGLVRDFPGLLQGPNLENSLTWAGLCFVFYVMPDSVNLVLTRSAPARRIRAGLAGLLAVAATVDFLITGSFLGGTLGVAFGVTLGYSLALLGASYVVSAAAAVPG